MKKTDVLKKQAQHIYILSILMGGVIFIDKMPDFVKGICILTSVIGLVCALLLSRSAKRHLHAQHQEQR